MISAEGAQLGIMSSRDAQLMARDAGLDLVEISPNANPPVVKIIDWGKYQYQKMKELILIILYVINSLMVYK